MAEQVAQQSVNNQLSNTDLKKNGKLLDFSSNASSGSGLTRERSFVRPNPQQQQSNKRRSLAFNHQPNIMAQQQLQHQQHIRTKPALEIYRPPSNSYLHLLPFLSDCQLIFEGFFTDVRLDSAAQNKLNVHAQEFTMNREMQNARAFGFFPTNASLLQHSKSSGSMQQQIQQLAARRHAVQMANLAGPRTILVTHPLQMRQLGLGVAVPSSQLPLVNSPSSGNVLNVSALLCLLLLVVLHFVSIIFANSVIIQTV